MIHRCVFDAQRYPPDKRNHRFFPLDPSDFYYPPVPGRTDRDRITSESLQSIRFTWDATMLAIKDRESYLLR